MGLLGAIPRIDESGDDPLVPIEGTPPSLVDLPPGCPFAPRCPLMRTECDTAPPPLRMIHDDHHTACLEPFGYRLPEQAA